MKTGILFDLDGTLLNTLEDLTDAVNYTLRHYGCPERTGEEVRRFIGSGARMLIERSLPGLDTDPDVQEALRFYQEYYNTHCQIKTRPYDGILDALAKLRQRYPMAIVSNKPDSATKTLCAQYFGDVNARGEGPGCPRKPAPDMVRRAMADIGVERCVYVGDSEVDVITAGNVGVPCLSVTWGFRDEDTLRAAGGEHFCGDPAQLPACIEKIVSEM